MTILRAVAWDIDGTLIDSEGLHHRALVETCRAHGADISDLPDDTFRGVHMLDVWTRLEPRFPERLQRQEWLDAVERSYITHCGGLTPMPEAITTVRALAARGITQACVSNSGRAVVDANIRALGIGDCLAFSISLDDVSAGKPDPAPYLLAAVRMGVAPETAVAVEDSSAGALSARRSGMVVLRYGDEKGEERDRWIAHLSDVLGLFDA